MLNKILDVCSLNQLIEKRIIYTVCVTETSLFLPTITILVNFGFYMYTPFH